MMRRYKYYWQSHASIVLLLFKGQVFKGDGTCHSQIAIAATVLHFSCVLPAASECHR